MDFLHCPKLKLILHIKTEPVLVGEDATVYIWFLGQINVNKSRIYNVACMRFCRDWLGLYAEIHIIFETV